MTDYSVFGWNDFFAEEWHNQAAPEWIRGRIAAEHNGVYEVWTADAAGTALLLGRLRQELTEAELPATGDWVALDASPHPDRPAMIQRVLARRTVFLRGAAGRKSRAQCVAANVDLVFVVCGLDEDFNLRRIERYLTRIRAGGARPIVVLNKADLDDQAASRVAETSARCPGVEILAISALTGSGLEAVRAKLLPGTTAALVGSSGAGKSTLVNALVGEELMPTSEVRNRDHRGCHTTTHRQLILLPGGGLLLDTPGMRELQLLDEEGLDETFADIEEIARGCRFADCRHDTEPGCAVKAALAAGSLDAERFDHYLALRHEAMVNERRHNVHQQRQAERAFSKMATQVLKHHRPKRSGR